jgi:NADH dehydrogenase [ubiquinone] 1 alpha subcomplex assembly factor 1
MTEVNIEVRKSRAVPCLFVSISAMVIGMMNWKLLTAILAGCWLSSGSPLYMSAENLTKKILFDASDTGTDSLVWQVVNDDVMGGISRSRLETKNGVIRFAGVVSLENNGGFASVRTLPRPLECAEATALVVRVRGDGRRYKFTARTDGRFDGVNYQHPFDTRADEWQEHRLPLSGFIATRRGRTLPEEPVLRAASLVSLGFLIADQQAGPFALEIEWIKAVR